MATDDIIIGTRLDVSGLNTGIAKMGSTISTASKTATTSLSGVASSVMGLINPFTVATGAAAAAGAAIANATKKTMLFADETSKSAQKMGLSIVEYQKVAALASLNGASVEAMSTAMRGLIKATDTQKESFDAIGVSIRDTNGDLKNQEQLFKETVLSLSRMKEGTDRAFVSQKLFGRSAAELAPTLNMGAEALEKYFATSENMVTVSEDLAKNSEIYNDSMEILGATISKLKNETLEPIVATLAQMAQQFVAIAGSKPIHDFFNDLNTVIGFTLEKMRPILFNLGLIKDRYEDLSGASEPKTIEALNKELAAAEKNLKGLVDQSNAFRKTKAGKDAIEGTTAAIRQQERAIANLKTQIASMKQSAPIIDKVATPSANAEKETDKLKEANWKKYLQFSEDRKRTEEHYKAMFGLHLAYAENLDRVMPSIGMSYGSNQTPLATQKSDGGEWQEAENARMLLQQEQLNQAKIQAALDTADTLINIGDMVANAAVARDQRELDSWAAKEQKKINGMKVSGKKKQQLEDQLAEEVLKREAEIAKKRGAIEIASTWATAASSSFQVWANLTAAGAKFGTPGMLAEQISAGVAIAGIMATAAAKTAIISDSMSGFEDGGVIGGFKGATKGRDNTVISARNGEMVLNAVQQKNLFDTINDTRKQSPEQQSQKTIVNNISHGGIVINGTVDGDTLDKIREVNDEFLYKLRDGIRTLQSAGEI